MIVGNRTIIYHPNKSVILDCTIGDDCKIHAPVWIGDRVVIGDRCRIQAFAFIPEGVTIGDDSFIGPNVTFTNDVFPPSNGENWVETYVGSNVVIGAGAVIVAGVAIQDGAKVAAGAVVTKDVEPGGWYAGIPAKRI